MKAHAVESLKKNELVENKTSLKVIEFLDERKKAWIDLEEDIEAISKKMRKIDANCKLLPDSRKNLQYLNDLLTLQHQSTFYAFLNGVENMIRAPPIVRNAPLTPQRAPSV